jgi:hypothetical protein
MVVPTPDWTTMTYSGVVLPLAYKTPANFNELAQSPRRFLAADPTVENVDHPVVKASPQQQLEPGRIRHDIALARRRRRANGHDLDFPLKFQASHQMRKRIFEPDNILVGIAIPRNFCHVPVHPARDRSRKRIWAQFSRATQMIFASSWCEPGDRSWMEKSLS